MSNQITELSIQAKVASEILKRILERRAGIHLSTAPIVQNRPIVEFMRRMRITSFEKFNTTTFISVINFYVSKEQANKDIPVGTMVLYVEVEYLSKLLHKLGYPVDETDENELLDACGTLCNLIAGNFKSGLCQLGYMNMEMSHFMSFKNEIFEGVLYPVDQTEKCEMSFEIEGEKRIMIDLVLGNIPKVEI
ncbi:MAG: chemotaxis protein CheX [Candidatus Omnitrophica bacterium]|nr:chemotaxis protein CheX [Candidatus Omnitrophota bacterium]